MPRRTKRPQATRTEVLECVQPQCPKCGELMWNAYDNHHTVTQLNEVVHLRLKVRRCVNPECARHHVPYRPEEEGRWALPHHEFGLDRGSPVLVDTMKCITADSKLVRRPPEIGSQSMNADADDYRTTRCI